MKNKRKWKSLNRRGLAALLTLAMCLGTVPFTAFAAEDTHEHNQNGWNCEWVEPEQELNCQHEHDEDCYVPGEPVLECTEDHHEEDCYVPGEDVLTCENEDEDHEHDEDCYASGEAVLECDEDHHTEDCYAPGEPVLDCRHEHGEDCFSAAEGFWSCTPPVEDAADEADKDVVEDEDQFDNDDNQGAIVEDETFEDDDQTDVEDEGVFNDDEQQNDIEDEDEALIPDEVQAFLDAVAELPDASEITEENFEEVGEQVNDVLDLYEGLSESDLERGDVAEALGIANAVVLAVQEAWMEYADGEEADTYAEKTDNVTQTAFSQFNPNTTRSNTVSGWWAETGYGKVVLSDENPTVTDVAFCHYWGAHFAGFPNGFYNVTVRNSNPAAVKVTTESTKSGLIVNFEKGDVDGNARIVIEYTITSLRTTANIASDSQTVAAFNGEIVYNVVGGDTPDTPPSVPGYPDSANLTGVTVWMICEKYNGYVGGCYKISGKLGDTRNTDGWYCSDIRENTGELGTGNLLERYPYACTLTLNNDHWVQAFEDTLAKNGINRGKHYLAPRTGTVSMTLLYNQETGRWNYDEDELYVYVTETIPRTTYTVTREYYVDDAKAATVTGSAKNGIVGDKIFGAELAEQNLSWNKYKIDGETFTFEYTSATPLILTLVKDASQNEITLRYDYTTPKVPEITGFEKKLVKTATEAPANVTDITYPDANGKVFVPADGTSITLLYKITVTGDAGAKYEVTDKGAEWVDGDPMKGTIPKGGEAVIYVTKSFTKSDIKDGHLYNVAKVVPGTGTDTNATTSESTPAEVEQKQEYTLKYDANGGEGAPSEMKQENATFTISSIEPVRADFVFAGWADTADAKEAKYQPNGTVTITDGNEKTLYAVWAQISVTKTMKKTEGSVDDGKLRNGDTVLYTVVVKNTGSNPLKNLEFFDDMDLKLTKPTKITIDSGWDVTSAYYPADDSNKLPLLHIYATGNTLGVGESVVVQYEAKIDGADGTKVINTVNVYAEIGEYVSAASRKMAAFRSNGPGGGASSEGETVGSSNVDVGDGTGERPKPPTGGVSGGDSTGENGEGTEKPPVVVPPNPALSVTKKADKTEASVGERITYTVTVTNTGDVALTGVTVKDTMAGKVTFVGEDSFESFDLAVKATKTITYTYEITADDAGKDITNDVSVTSDEVKTPVPGSATVKVKPVEPENVTITIEYVDEADKTTIGTFTKEFDKGNEYNVIDDIKAPEGYVIINIDGQTEGIADKNDTITVTCRKDEPSNATVTYPEYTDDNTTPVTQSDEVAPGTTIIVDPNGGLWTPPEGSEWDVEGDTFKHVAEAGEQIALTVPTKDGNVFVGWTKAEATDENGDKTITFTAQWVEADGRHTITVNRVHNGNTIVSIPVTVPDGEAYTVTDVDAPAAFDNGGNHYIRIDATLPAVPAGDEDVSVDVRYALDNIGGGTNGNSPDGIPDGQQAVVYYRSSNTAYGTVRDAYQMFDLRPDIASREETLRNAATVVGRARFTNWTMGSQALSTNATLENAFTVEAGHTYTVTANFTGYTGGGSSGGGGGGGGSSSGNTSNNNNTNNDTTTNDDTVTINDAEVPLADLTSLNREDHFAYVSGYTDGTVRPTNNITREEVAAIFYRLLTDVSRTVYETGVNNFSDVDSSRWSNNAISTLANAGIISGYKEGTFKPGQTITRAEFAAIASRFDSVSENVTNPFTDTEGHWAEQLISNAADKGWVGGYPDSTFRPSNAITRAEAMTLINKVLNREVDKEGLLADAKQWPDNQEGKWYYYQVLEATNSHDYERRSADSYVENWTAITQK